MKYIVLIFAISLGTLLSKEKTVVTASYERETACAPLGGSKLFFGGVPFKDGKILVVGDPDEKSENYRALIIFKLAKDMEAFTSAQSIFLYVKTVWVNGENITREMRLLGFNHSMDELTFDRISDEEVSELKVLKVKKGALTFHKIDITKWCEKRITAEHPNLAFRLEDPLAEAQGNPSERTQGITLGSNHEADRPYLEFE